MQSKILGNWQQERHRWLLWAPVAYGLGIGIYFSLENEPAFAALFGGLGLAVLLVLACAWKARPILWLAIAVLLASSGMLGAAKRTQDVAAPYLKEELPPRMVEAVVEDIQTQPDNTRLILKPISIERIAPEELPRKITVSLRERAPAALEIGDMIRMRAGLFPPPVPGIAGGFQFNRHFYFQQIGAVGFQLGKTPPEIIGKHEVAESGIDAFRRRVNARLREVMSEREGSVATALTTGDQRAIPEDVQENMRAAGITHILSISGTHLGLLATLSFFAVRLLLALIPAFALRHDTKKWAAVIALFATFGYLLLAGSPVPAQRSFVMVVFVLLAVLLDRFVTALRSITLAAMIILVFIPESLLGPSFQLSFAATLAIITYYENRYKELGEKGFMPLTRGQKFWRFWSAILITSGLATLATAPFILHHFDSFPTYSVLGNLLALPVVSFIIMPAIITILVCWPFGVPDVLFSILKFGIALMLKIAEWIAALPAATFTLPPLGLSALLVMVLGGLWLCFWQQKWRHWGWVPIIAGLLTLPFYCPPDMVISADGKKLALRTQEERVVMLRGKRTGFLPEQWLRFLQVPEFSLAREKQDSPALRCDNVGCHYQWNGQKIAVVFHRDALEEDCGWADLVIAPDWSIYGTSRKRCGGAWLLDRQWLEKAQGTSFWLEDGKIRYKTVRETLGHRPWSGD